MQDLALFIYPTIAGLLAGLAGIALADLGAGMARVAGAQRGSGPASAQPQTRTDRRRGAPRRSPALTLLNCG